MCVFSGPELWKNCVTKEEMQLFNACVATTGLHLIIGRRRRTCRGEAIRPAVSLHC